MGSACDLRCQEPGHTFPQDQLHFLRYYYYLLKYKGVASAEEVAEGGSFHATARAAARDGFSIPSPLAGIGPQSLGLCKEAQKLPPPSRCDGGLPQLRTRGPITQHVSTWNQGWGKHEGFTDQGKRELASRCPTQAGWARRSTAQASHPPGN